MRTPWTTALVAVALLLTGATGIARAQTEEEPLTIEVISIHVPSSLGKLTSPGVRVTARCNRDCLILVKVRLPDSVAAKLGLNKTVIGTGVEEGLAGTDTNVRATVRSGVVDRLRGYRGSKNLRLTIQALP